MLKIQRSSNGQLVLVLSGQIEEQHITELEAQMGVGTNRSSVVLDLKEVTLVSREAIAFLERCEASGVTLKNCPAYVREWVIRERRGG
jgi:hypothetical protein